MLRLKFHFRYRLGIYNWFHPYRDIYQINLWKWFLSNWHSAVAIWFFPFQYLKTDIKLKRSVFTIHTFSFCKIADLNLKINNLRMIMRILKVLQFCYIKTHNELEIIQIYSLHKHSYSVKMASPYSI